MGMFRGGVMLDHRTWRPSAVAGVTLRAVDPATGEFLPTMQVDFPDSPTTVTTNGAGAYGGFVVPDYDTILLQGGGVTQPMSSEEVLAGKAGTTASADRGVVTVASPSLTATRGVVTITIGE